MNEEMNVAITEDDRRTAQVFPRSYPGLLAALARLDYADRHGGQYPSDAAVRKLERKLARALGVDGEAAQRKPPPTTPAGHLHNTGHRDHGQQSQPPR